MTHAIKGRSFVTQNASNVVFVIPCFINRIRETSTFIPFRGCSVTEQPSGWIIIAPCSVSCSQSTTSVSVLGTTRASSTRNRDDRMCFWSKNTSSNRRSTFNRV